MYFAAHGTECGQQPGDCAAFFHDAQIRRLIQIHRLKPVVTNHKRITSHKSFRTKKRINRIIPPDLKAQKKAADKTSSSHI